MTNAFNDVPWERISGYKLISIFENSKSLEFDLPSNSGIYMWKLNLVSHELDHTNPIKIINKIEKALSTPQGSVKSNSHHSVDIDIKLKGKGLSDKIDIVTNMAHNNNIASWMIDFLNGLNYHMPSLYVGQTQNIRERIEDHLSGRSGFSEVLAKNNEYGFEDLSLFYLELKNAEKDVREALEYIVTILTLGTYTGRIG